MVAPRAEGGELSVWQLRDTVDDVGIGCTWISGEFMHEGKVEKEVGVPPVHVERDVRLTQAEDLAARGDVERIVRVVEVGVRSRRVDSLPGASVFGLE